ncbi:hypothetical protein J2T55_000078 [Methylohalomonas lacus]|uniref:Uncharacterized protein n=1 Tax=Methylohalomonas lacus TaxID=398773 RepID=A0AAE3HJ78_9GAMM|nr:hypothetical protein [Methylohalomonas lacus]MCS3902086.1 hypothetical protein [Methylohalomonas lacus]
MSLPWFRLYAEFAADPVIQSLAFEDQRHYVILLCQKCNGVLDRNIAKPAKDRIIGKALGLDNAVRDEAKRRLMEVDLIDDKWQPKAWNKRQFLSDNSTERVRKYRKSKESENVPETDMKRSGNAPDTDTDTDTDQDKDLAQKRFDEFWSAYPRKRSKGQARKAWNKIGPGEQLFQQIMAGLQQARNSFDWQKDNGQFIPYPATWLNACGWEDEYQTQGGQSEDVILD